MKKCCFLYFFVVVISLSGCGHEPISFTPTITKLQYTDGLATINNIAASPTSANYTVHRVTVTTDEPTPIARENEENEKRLPTEDQANPEETLKPGVWVEDPNYRNGRLIDGDIVYNLKQSGVKASEVSTQHAKEYKVVIGEWEYFFDTDNAVLVGGDYDQEFEFLLCRKNNKGEVVSLDVYGSMMEAGRGFLFLHNNTMIGPECVTWDTWMLAPDGKKVAYLGQIHDIFFPNEGDCFYYSDSFDMKLYKMDFTGINRSIMAISLPDQDAIFKEIPIPYFLTVKFKRMEEEWLYFSADIDSFFEKRYIGGYKLNVSDGEVVKTGEEEWLDYSQQ